jgi:hypothetical protein
MHERLIAALPCARVLAGMNIVSIASAQNACPTKPIRLVVPHLPLMARILNSA